MGINKILKNNIHPNVDILSHFHQYMSYICSLRSPNPLFPLCTKSASKSEQWSHTNSYTAEMTQVQIVALVLLMLLKPWAHSQHARFFIVWEIGSKTA